MQWINASKRLPEEKLYFISYFFIYKRIGKKQTLNLWSIIVADTLQSAEEHGKRTLFIGDFQYEYVATILDNR